MAAVIKELTAMADQLKYGATHLVKVKWTDLNDTAGLTKTVPLLTLRAGHVVRSVKCKVKTAFAGTTTLVAEIGDTGDVDRNLASQNMKTAAYKSLQPTTTNNNVATGAATLDALFTATVDNLTALSAGEVWYYIFIEDMAESEGPRD